MPDGHVVPRGFQIVTSYLNRHEKEYEISFRIIRIFSAIGSRKEKTCSAGESATVICEKGHSRPGISLPNRLQLELDGRQMSGFRLLWSRKNRSVRQSNKEAKTEQKHVLWRY